MFTNVWGVFKLLYFEDDFCILTNIPKRDKRGKINFDELPKINSRIKIITIKI